MAYVYPTAVHSVSDSFADHVARGSVNPGTDYMSAYGDLVVAVAAGTVTDASNDNGGGGGRTIHIDHDDGSGSDYLHLSDVVVSAGQWVGQGYTLGYSGASGNGDDWYYGAHLHLSFRPNHSHGYGNNGNQDFDAIMAGQGGTPDTPTEPKETKEDIEMRVASVPNGTLALVGEYTGKKYTSMSGNEGFSLGANRAGYGESPGLTEDQVSTLVSEAATRRSSLVADVAARVEAEIGASAASVGNAVTALWLLVIGAVLVVLALVIPAIFSVKAGTATGTLAEFVVGIGAVLIGFGIATIGGRRGGGKHSATESDGASSE